MKRGRRTQLILPEWWLSRLKCDPCDGGSTFYPIDEIDSASAGSTNTYQATGLIAGSNYQFYITAESSAAESTATNTVNQTTTFDPPTLDVEGTGTVVEGSPYELDLTADYPDGEPGAIDHWLVDWNDGPGGTSDLIPYSYPSGADLTLPLAVTHTFAAGIDSPIVTVQAVDTVNDTFTSDPQQIAVIPVAPSALNDFVASGTQINMAWATNSSLAAGTIIFDSTDDINFSPIYEVPAGTDWYYATNLNPDTQYYFEVETDSDNGQSDPSNVIAGKTDYVAPTLTVTPKTPVTEGNPLSLALTWTAAAGAPTSDGIDHWEIDWGDGNGPQSIAPSASGVELDEQNTYANATTSAQVIVTAVDESGRTLAAFSQLISITPIVPVLNYATYGSQGASVVLAWSDASQVATDYLVQRIDPTVTPRAWVTESDVSANPDPTNHPNYYFSENVTAGTNGSGRGYLYRVIAEGPQVASGVARALSSPSKGLGPVLNTASRQDYIEYYDGGGASPAGLSTGGGTFTNNSGIPTVPIGGFSELPVFVINASGVPQPGVTVNVIGFDPSILLPLETSVVTDSTGQAWIPVEGIAIGTSPLIVADSNGDENGGDIPTFDDGSSSNDTPFNISTTGTTPVGGLANWVNNLVFPTVPVNAANLQQAVFAGITGNMFNPTTGQTINYPDPNHFILSADDTLIFSPVPLTISQTTYMPVVPSPVPTTDLTYDVLTQNSLLLTVTDVNNVDASATASAGQISSMHVGEQQGGTVTLNLDAIDQTGFPNGKIKWAIFGGEVNESSGTFVNGDVEVLLTPGDIAGGNDYVIIATEGNLQAEDDVNVGHLTVSTESVPNTTSTSTTPGGGNTPGVNPLPPGAKDADWNVGDTLPKDDQGTVGVFLPFDDLDEDYDGNADYLELTGATIPGGGNRKGVSGDTLMLQISLASLPRGFYALSIPQGFGVFRDNNGNNVYSLGSSGPWLDANNGNQPLSLWVACLANPLAHQQQQNQFLRLYYSPTQLAAGTFPSHWDDEVRLRGFVWTGSQDVPDNSTYRYKAQGDFSDDDRPLGTDGWTAAVGSTHLASSAADHSDIADITWGTGPEFGEAVFTSDKFYQWEFTVNVVHVALSDAAMNSTTPSASNYLNTSSGAPSVFKVKTNQGVLISSVDTTASNPSPAMQAQITIAPITGMKVNGQGVMRGVKWIQVGFIQQVQIAQETGTYVDPGAGGKTYQDAAQIRLGMTPVLGSTSNQSNTAPPNPQWYIDGQVGYSLTKSSALISKINRSAFPWLDSNNTGGTTPPALSPISPGLISDTNPVTSTFGTRDTPKIYGGPSVLIDVSGEINSPVISSVAIQANFNLSIAVATTKLDDPLSKSAAGNVSEGIYTARGTAKWVFIGTGQVETAKSRGVYEITGFKPDSTGGTFTDTSSKQRSTTFKASAAPISWPPSSRKFANELPYGFQWGGNQGEPAGT